MNQASNQRFGKVFRFGNCRYDTASGEAFLSYQMDRGPELVEKLVFPDAPWPTDHSRQAAFEQALNLLHLVAGVSYYKAGLASEIQFQGSPPQPEITDFLTRLYVQGLAEFAYVNKVDVASRFQLHVTAEAKSSDRKLALPDRALVAMGGGKDSLVGLDLLRQAGVQVMPVCVGSSSLIGETVQAAKLPLLRIHRQLAPELAELNQAGAWNGHVPVTAINSAILVCAAVLYGFRYVVFSNERSANEATLTTSGGLAVNHQYSKTSAFELAFQQVVHDFVSPDIDYFSILRPFSELEIVRRFCSLTVFHSVYSSCIRNFHLEGSSISGRWCGNCPKCRFAALSLAVFQTPDQVNSIMGADLLDDLSQEEGFRALCELGLDKPFECVGEAGESRAALAALSQSVKWKNHAVVRDLAPMLDGIDVPDMESLLRPSGQHFIPSEIYSALSDQFS